MTRDVRILLHDIRSAHNVGSIFRTADAAGASTIYLSGYTPAPVDRFGRAVKEIAKVALGGERSVAWEKVASPARLITKLKKEGYQIIGIEQDKKSVDYKKILPAAEVLFIVGNEVGGISRGLLRRCDVVAEIPMKGEKESLNVGVSLGIALFRMLGI